VRPIDESGNGRRRNDVLTRIDVKQRHIMHGQRGKCNACPVALAIKEKVLKTTGVEVATYSVELTNWDGKNVKKVILNPPLGVARFVSYFDAGDPVQPFSFDLDIPEGF
jgi:hypothetical protein